MGDVSRFGCHLEELMETDGDVFVESREMFSIKKTTAAEDGILVKMGRETERKNRYLIVCVGQLL
jgi:hypothetical protein